METTERIVAQINVATTISVVRVLSKSLHSWLTILQTCCLSVLFVCGSYVTGHQNTLVLLSRRISMLLLVESIKPFLAANVPGGLGMFTHVQLLMTNLMVVCLLGIVPAWWRSTMEGNVVVTAVIYLYTSMLDFADRKSVV